MAWTTSRGLPRIVIQASFENRTGIMLAAPGPVALESLQVIRLLSDRTKACNTFLKNLRNSVNSVALEERQRRQGKFGINK